VKLLEEILIWGTFAMSLDLLMGYAGMVSFGHSAFFGVGGYLAALLLRSAPGAATALLLPALGRPLRARHRVLLDSCERRLLHHADAGVLPDVLRRGLPAAWLGAEDGIVGVPRPIILGVNLGQPMSFHLYLVALCAVAALVLWRVVRSPFGHVLRGIHENEARMQALATRSTGTSCSRSRSRGSSPGWRARSTRSSSAPSRPTRSSGRPPGRCSSW